MKTYAFPVPTPPPQKAVLPDNPQVVILLDDPSQKVAIAGFKNQAGAIVARVTVYSGADYDAAGAYTSEKFSTDALAILATYLQKTA